MRRMNSITTLTMLGVLVLVACAPSASATTEWMMEISAEMAGDAPITADLTYGVSSSATDGFDDGLDEDAPPADPSGFDAHFNEPGAGTGRLTVDIKSLGTIKDWTLIAVAPATKTVNVSWTPGDILSNVEMEVQELDLGTGEPTGPVIDMKTQGLITFTGGAFAATTKAYRITATSDGTMNTYYRDADGDGYGDPEDSVEAESAPVGYVEDNTDCDDTNADVNPRATEICNGIDDDCDGVIDEGVMNTYCRDADGDGYGDPEDSIEACSAPEGYVEDNTDCDDTNADVNPGATEVCNGIDDDCDGVIDEGVMNTYCRDADGDGYGDPEGSIEACSAPVGYVEDNTDCDDTNANVNPGATEVCGNGIDDDCDGEVDEGCDTTEWAMEISAEMAGDTPITADLTYGVSSSATDGFDEGFDEDAPPADPSGFDAYFNEPGVGTGRLIVDIKSLDTIKDWTLIAVAPATRTVNVSWVPGGILSNVEMKMQELDLDTGELTGPAIDMKTEGLITVTGGAFAATTKAYRITATTSVIVPPELVSCVIDPDPPVVQGTNVSVDCLFSEMVNYEICIENATGYLVEMIGEGTAKDPDLKWWNTTTDTPAGIYTVHVAMYNSTIGLSSYNDTNTIEVTQVEDTTPPYTSGHDPAPDAAGVSIDTDVTVHVLDDVTGVNVSTIVMTVNDTVVTPEITGTPADYTLVYNPPADFNHDQMVNVTIDASDLAGNEMHDAYSFTTAVATTTIIAIDDAIASTGGNDDVTPVMISNNVVNVGVVRIDIHYDPSVVRVVDVADGDFDFITSSIDNAVGVVRIGAMQVASSGLNGDVLLAEVTLQAKGAQGNTSALSIDIKELKDATPQCNPIQAGVEDGIFTVSCLCGDVNEDGNVLLDDAMYLVKHCVEEPGFEQINECASDVDCDGVIDMADAMYLAKHCVGVQGFEKLHCCAG